MNNETDVTKPRDIGGITNAYGGLSVKMIHVSIHCIRCFWRIEDYDGSPNNDNWEEIPKPLYDQLNAFQDSKEAS